MAKNRLFLAFVLVNGAFGLASCVSLDTSDTQSVLRNILSRQAGMELGTPSRPDPILAFYQTRNFRPAWTGSAKAEEMAARARAALARADAQGLNSDDYRLPAEPRLRTGPQAAAYDVMLTGAVIRYAHDVRNGRFRPSDIYKDVGLPSPTYDAAADLNQALQRDAIARFFTDLLPPHPEYQRLAGAYGHYKAIADKGGWASLQGGSEIRLEGRDARVQQLIKRLAFEDDKFAGSAKPSTAELRAAVRRFQARNGLGEDGRVGGKTLAALNIPASDRAEQIAANMERWRWLPPQFEPRYVAVNVPNQTVEFVRDGKTLLESRVIVGRKSSRTPITRSAITSVVVNPPWNIPGDIAARDLLPQLKRNSNYLVSKNMVVVDGPPNDPHGRTIDWRKIVPAEFPYAIRQLPGPTTALGALMLDSPNDFDVYLHDTPNKKLFDSDLREISNGCVRVQQIFPLASLALTDDKDDGMAMLTKATRSRETQRLALDRPLPVYFLYWTAVAGDDGSVEFLPDRYGRDEALIAAMTKADRRFAKSESPPDEPAPMDADDISP